MYRQVLIGAPNKKKLIRLGPNRLEVAT